MNQKKQEVDPGVAYILWTFGLMGFCGIHRFYSGKITSGLVYFLTFGFFGVGQFVDLFLIFLLYLTVKFSLNKFVIFLKIFLILKQYIMNILVKLVHTII